MGAEKGRPEHEPSAFACLRLSRRRGEAALTATAAIEVATIARRLAWKLGCPSILLIGCVRAPLVAELADRPLAGFDAPEHTSYAAALAPSGRWGGPDELAGALPDLAESFVVLSSAALEELGDEALSSLLRAAPVALVIDIDASAGTGPTALRRARDKALARGLEVVHGELTAAWDSVDHRRSSPSLLVAGGHHPGADALTATGFGNLRLDPDVDSWSRPSRPSRVCVVSYEVVGPSRNGGIGTANTSLALALARGGLDVTLLFTGAPVPAQQQDHWVAYFAERRVRYMQVEADASDAVSSAFLNVRRAWATYEAVRRLHEERPFDVIHGPECQGHLAFIAQAKRHGVDFQQAQIVTGVHSPTRWCMEANRVPLDTLTGLVDEELEQASVRCSDAVHSPSGYLLGYLRDRGWTLPERSFVQQYVTSDAIRELESSTRSPAGPDSGSGATEIVFFGRLETRKGLELFCDALDCLAGEDATPEASVTFMGSEVTVDGIDSTEYVRRRSATWPWPTRIETGLSQPEAIAYLRANRCIAVMPSLVDNSPNTVYEALALAIPIVVSHAGGTGELIALDDLERCAFSSWLEGDGLEPPSAEAEPARADGTALAHALRAALSAPPAPASPAVDPVANEAVHLDWNAALAGACVPEPAVLRPSVSQVVVAGAKRAGAIAARLSEAPDGDVVIATDSLPAGLPAHWTAVDTSASDSVSAHASAAWSAAGDYLLFWPEHVDPEPGAADAVGRAAAGSDAEVLLLVARDPALDGGAGEVVVPVGGPAVVGLSHHVQGSNGFAVRAEAFRRLGGFRDPADPLGGFLTRASLAHLVVETLPEVLGQRTEASPTRLVGRGGPWPEGVVWDSVGEARLAQLRPFVESSAGLKDLPALYRQLQELMSHVRQEQIRQFTETSGHVERVQAHAERTRAHAEHVQAHADRLQEQADLTQAEYDRLVAVTAEDSEQAQREVQRLRRALEVIEASASWRMTSPLRKVARRRREGGRS